MPLNSRNRTITHLTSRDVEFNAKKFNYSSIQGERQQLIEIRYVHIYIYVGVHA